LAGSVTSAMYAFAVVKLAENIAEITRPTSSHGSDCARAMKMKSTPRPRHESRIVGRRPKRSDIAPCSGAHTNWIAANNTPNTPTQCAARTVSPPTNSFNRCGSTGMMSPKARMSIRTVTKMKTSAALRAPGAAVAVTGGWLGGT
jgi:hypothetical protein